MRTTNDVKGWHTHLANHAGLSISSKGLNLYILLKFLYEEAIQVDIYTKMLGQLVPKKTQLVPKRRILVPKRKDFLRNEKILNTRGDQAFYMGAENAKIESAEKSAETGGHRHQQFSQPSGSPYKPIWTITFCCHLEVSSKF